MPETLRAIAALCLVLAALLGCAYGLRRLLHTRLPIPHGTDLSVMAWRTLDTRRKLALIRWQDTEYLLCLGPSNDCVIDQRPLPANPVNTPLADTDTAPPTPTPTPKDRLVQQNSGPKP